MKTLIPTLALTAALTAAPLAFADEWVDYAPTKEPWTVTTVKVAPGKLDDYIVGLKKSYADQLERQKKNGEVLDYHILVNTSPNAAGATIVFLTKYKDWNALIPNKDRDLKEQDEFRKTITKTDEDKMGEDRSKFRTFLDDGTYSDITYLK
ncbi:MAG TPA: hypothetical protein VH722_09180 [Alphaproteobacteria bacterium]|jgi:hypothetical protein|nr:hypothetical protein [Alphaproteobacteria bacterium]